jgi:hypothetical protein
MDGRATAFGPARFQRTLRERRPGFPYPGWPHGVSRPLSGRTVSDIVRRIMSRSALLLR